MSAFPLNTALFGFRLIWPTPHGTDTIGLVFIGEAVHCVLFSSGFVFLWPASGSLPFSEQEQHPWRLALAVMLPHPIGSADPVGGGSLVPGKPVSFAFLGSWHVCVWHSQGLAAVPVADFLTWVFSGECRLINAGQVVELSKRSW